MATRDQLRNLLTAQPFAPFLIRRTGGRAFTVRHPENAACDLRGRALTVYDEKGMHSVEMLLVEVMQPVNSASAGDGNGPQQQANEH
jgi:hypothetical protein